jgi:hypothetical protein
VKHFAADLWIQWLEFRLGRKAIGLDRFDEQWYLAHNPDVAVAVQNGQFRSGREHYIRFGFSEDRRTFDPTSPAATGSTLPPQTRLARIVWSLVRLWDIAQAQVARARRGARSGIRRPRPSALESSPDAAQQPACVEFALRVEAQTWVLTGWSKMPFAAPTAASSDNREIELSKVSTHRRSDLATDDARGFVAIVTLGDPQAMPASVAFGDARVRIDGTVIGTAFSQFCSEAAAETLFDVLRLAPDLPLSERQWKPLSRAAGKQLARFTDNIVETASATASIDNAWSSGRSGAVVFHGRLIDTGSRSPAECFCVAQAGRDFVPVALTRTSRTPPGETAPTTSFIGSSRLSRPAWRSRIFVIVKDAEDDFAVIARRPLMVDEAGLFETAIGLIAPALRHDQDAEHQSPGSQQVCTLLGDLFPFEIERPIDQPPAAPMSGRTRTCHFFLEVGSTPQELRSILGELIGERFDRIVVTCMTDRPGPIFDNVQRAVEFDHPDVEVIWHVTEYGPDSLAFKIAANPDDLVIFGRPLDILQFDLSEGAIDKAIGQAGTGGRRSVGYLHGGVALERRSEEELPGPAPDSDALKRNLLMQANGLAAIMPAAHFLLGARPPAPALFHPANQVKALLLELERADLAEFASFTGAEFFSTVERRPTLHGLEPQVLDWIDFCRIGSGG